MFEIWQFWYLKSRDTLWKISHLEYPPEFSLHCGVLCQVGWWEVFSCKYWVDILTINGLTLCFMNKCLQFPVYLFPFMVSSASSIDSLVTEHLPPTLPTTPNVDGRGKSCTGRQGMPRGGWHRLTIIFQCADIAIVHSDKSHNVYMGQVTKLRLSCYLVLLSTDSCSSVTSPICTLIHIYV